MSKTVVGKLYMNGCVHCDNLVEPWNQMKNKVGGKVEVADDIEAAQTNELNELNNKYKTDVGMQGGYPTIYKIVGGKVEYYNGERITKELINWALKSDGKRGSKSLKRGSKSLKRGGKSLKQSRRQRQSRN